MSLSPISSIADAYAVFKKANVPEGAPLSQQSDMQRAFYGGFITMMRINLALAEYDEILAVLFLEKLRIEGESFAASTIAIAGAQHHD